MKCDLCKRKLSRSAYKVPTTNMGAVVMVCEYCGLAQSSFSTKKNIRGITASSDADFGNIRYGKAFRVKNHLSILDRFVRWKDINRVLDIGSNRGAFIEMVRKRGNFQITAVESDVRISPSYREYKEVALYPKRIEHVDFRNQTFDLIYSSHTFEHLDSVFNMFEQMEKIIKEGTLLLVEVPCIKLIASSDIVEEWFIDAHTFHLSRNSLKKYLSYFGWTVLYENNSSIKDVITILASKDKLYSNSLIAPDHQEVRKVTELIVRYKKIRMKNTKRLRDIAHFVESLQSQKIAIWGAGRIFDSIVKYGELNLNKNNILFIIDTHLPYYKREVYGKKIYRPEEINFKDIDTLLVFSRNFINEIKEAAFASGFKGKIFDYATLLNNLKHNY